MAKMLEDGFRAVGILEEDDASHVARSIIEVSKLGKPARTKDMGDPGKASDAKIEDYVEIIINQITQ